MNDGLMEVVELDAVAMRKAELVSEIQRESDVQQDRADLQKEAARLEDSIAPFIQQTRSEIRALQNQEQVYARQLVSIERMRDELLNITPEGRRIKTLLAEMQELRFPGGSNVLVLKRHQQQIAKDNSLSDPSEMVIADGLGREIAKIESRIAEHSTEVTRLWAVLLSEPITATV